MCHQSNEYYGRLKIPNVTQQGGAWYWICYDSLKGVGGSVGGKMGEVMFEWPLRKYPSSSQKVSYKKCYDEETQQKWNSKKQKIK